MQEPRDYSSHEEFFSYYAEKSARPEFVERFRSLQNAILRFLHGRQWDGQCLDVIDVGCNAGTQCVPVEASFRAACRHDSTGSRQLRQISSRKLVQSL